MASDIDTLVTRWKRGDEAAAEALYNLHRPRLYALAYSLLDDGAEADDVVQVTRHAGRSIEADGLWTPLATRPSYFLGFLPSSADERLWFGGPDETPALLDMTTHQWRLPADPCAVPPLVDRTS